MHALIPDVDDPEGWIVRLSNWRNANIEFITGFARAYTSPEADKVNRYMNATNFSHRKDDIIALALVLLYKDKQSGDVSTLVAKAKKSLYARALAQG